MQAVLEATVAIGGTGALWVFMAMVVQLNKKVLTKLPQRWR